jgi:hypothetical protein
LQRKIEQWEQQRNTIATKVDWQFTTEQARIKLRSLYPSHHSRRCTSRSWAIALPVPERQVLAEPAIRTKC